MFARDENRRQRDSSRIRSNEALTERYLVVIPVLVRAAVRPVHECGELTTAKRDLPVAVGRDGHPRELAFAPRREKGEGAEESAQAREKLEALRAHQIHPVVDGEQHGAEQDELSSEEHPQHFW